MPDESSSALLIKECELASGIIMRYRELEGWMQRQFAIVWCSLMGVGYQMGNANLHLVAGIATLIAWYWDARYVTKRRAMRRRYEIIAAALSNRSDALPISDPLSLNSGEVAADFRTALFSRPLAVFYGTTIAVSLFVWIVRAFLQATAAS